jgi:hypothetical protein
MSSIKTMFEADPLANNIAAGLRRMSLPPAAATALLAILDSGAARPKMPVRRVPLEETPEPPHCHL